jgi:putative transposase
VKLTARTAPPLSLWQVWRKLTGGVDVNDYFPVNHPREYPCSSFPYNGAGDPDNRITEHDVYERLGRSRSERAYRYQTLFSTALDQKAIHAIRTAASFSMPLGNNRFKAQIEAALGPQIGQAKRSRPLRCLQD